MKQKMLLGMLMLIVAFGATGQDINFSQFYELPLLRNPALAGKFRGDIRATSAFRSQWNSVTVPYKTQALGVELKSGVSANSDDYISLGMQITNDVAGDSKLGKTQLLPMIAYHKLMNSYRNTYISVGFLGGAVQQRFDPTGLKFDDQFVGGAYSATNPTRQTFTNTNVIYWDAAAGVTYSSETDKGLQYYIGAAYFHVSQPKVAFNPDNDMRLNRKIVFNLGISTPVGEYNTLILYADYFSQGGNSQAQGGVLYKHDMVQADEIENVSLSMGAFYRVNDAIVPVVKLDYYKWGIGLTYDANINKLKQASNGRGGFELTLSYKSFLNIRNTSADKMRCPVAF
ncbi:MAG: type secretion system rane protein PorP/SprF [Flaviaesturariibacter sp.]|nr:type secretion system rane protein PorP/SprF [Flaviaesturariibacter sp.]